jgi:LysR family transcriptional regulator for bpeEF and oprC
MYPLEFNKDGEHIEPDAPYRLAVNESNAHTTAVLAGLGASQMVTFIAKPYLDSGDLVQILPDWTRGRRCPIYVVYPPNRHLSAKVRAFVDWAAELFTKHPHLQKS